MSYKWPGIPNGDYSFDHGRAVWNKIINYLRRLSEKLDSDIVDATADRRGMMTAADKDKLDGVEPGAEVNQNAFSGVKVGSSTIEADAKTDVLELVAGTNISLTVDTTNDKVTITNTYEHPTYTARTGKPTQDLTPGFGDTVTISQIVSDGTGHVTAANDKTITIPSTEASQSTAGLMSATDKTKLDGIASGAEVNQNAFSNIQVGPATVAADSKTDTLTLGPGAGVIISANTTNDSITIGCVEATQSVPGIMSTADKTKLDGIATGAEVNQNAFSNVKVGSTTVSADGKTDTLELEAGTGITLTPDATNDKVTIAVTSGTYADASHTHPYIPTAGGDITGAITQTNASTATLKFTDTTGRVTIGGGTAYNTGAYIWLYGKDHASEPGYFDIDANNGTTYSRLRGTPDGALTWRGESILNQNAFSNVKVGSTTIAADTTTDTLEFVAGSNVTLTPDATNDKVTISATDVNVTATKVATFPSSSTNYYLLASSSDATATEGVSKFGTNARLQVQAGTTSAEGRAEIILGNNTAAGTAGNVTGRITLYNNAGKYLVISPHSGDTSNRTVYMPKSGGTLVCHTTDTAIGSATMPVYINADGVATACTYELKKTVPADAVFTDHIYTAASDAPQPVTAVGAVGTSDKYAREDHIHARRCAHVGQSGSSTTNPWFKFATFTINANWIGNETTFMVTGPYLDRYGILVVRFTSNGSKEYSNSSVKWLVTYRIFPENFMLVVGNDNKTLELWAKCGSAYERYTFTVLSETSRGGPQSLWTLLTSVSAGEAAAPTAGTQVVSTLEGASGKLGTNNVGSVNQPIYLAAGVATACTVEGVVAQDIDTSSVSGHNSYIKLNSGLVFIWGSESFVSNTYVDITKKISCTTIVAFAANSETTAVTGVTSNLQQIHWVRPSSTNTTERFATNTTTTGYFNYMIIGKA